MAEPWIDTDQVLAHLAVNRRTLRKLQHDAEAAGIRRPWVNIGSDLQPYYKWKLSQVDPWLEKVTEWRATTSRTTANTRSAGATATAQTGLSPSQISTRQKRSSSQQKRQPLSATSTGRRKTLLND